MNRKIHSSYYTLQRNLCLFIIIFQLLDLLEGLSDSFSFSNGIQSNVIGRYVLIDCMILICAIALLFFDHDIARLGQIFLLFGLSLFMFIQSAVNIGWWYLFFVVFFTWRYGFLHKRYVSIPIFITVAIIPIYVDIYIIKLSLGNLFFFIFLGYILLQDIYIYPRKKVQTLKEDNPAQQNDNWKSIVQKILWQAPELNKLSDSEKEVVVEFYMYQGNVTNKELANILGTTEIAIKNLLYNIYKKLPNLHTRTRLFSYVDEIVQAGSDLDKV